LWREIAAWTDLRQHGADHETCDLLPRIARH
jgi:hypothetical protein